MKRLLILAILALLIVPASADYTLPVQALTNSPADGATNYIGGYPSAPTTTVNISIQYIPVAGTINVVEIYDYSGTAGTNQAYSYYLRMNNTQDYLIATVSSTDKERIFSNTSMNIPAVAGNFFEIKRVHPTWTTNPLTNTVGGYVLVDTSGAGDDGYTVFGQALTNTPADNAINYIGGLAVAPSTAEGNKKVFLPDDGTLATARVTDYSGTAGTAEAYAYSLNVNGTNTAPIQSLSQSLNLRIFGNSSMNVDVLRGNYFEWNRTHPTWATNPATNVMSASAFVHTGSTKAHAYPIALEAITTTPADGATVYFGNRPIAPSATAGTNKIYVRQAGTIVQANVYAYSGTAGTGEAWTMNVVKNGVDTYQISTQSVAANERVWWNQSIDIPVAAGDYLEIQSVQPKFATNPATTIYGGYLYQMYDGAPPKPSFTASNLSGTPPTLVTVTDTSITDILSRIWTAENTLNSTILTFGSGVSPASIDLDTGHWLIRETVTNISETRTSLPVLIPVNPSGGYTGFVQQDIWMTGAYLVRFTLNDANGNLISNATILSSSGQTNTTGVNGVGEITENFGSSTITFSADGYYSRVISYIIDDDADYTVTLTRISTPVTLPPSIRYVPHLVRFVVKDFYGQPVSEINVTSQSVSSTASDNWILNLLGLDMTTIPLTNSTLAGTSGTDGSVVFMMLETVQYQVTFTNVAKGVSEVVTLYPKEDSYLVLVSTSAAGDADSNWGVGSGTIYRQLASSQTGTKFFLNLSYIDSEHYTSSVFFYVEDGNRTPVYNTTYSGHSNNFSYMIDPFPHGASYYYGYTATNSAYGTLSGNAIATTHSRLLAPLEYLGWDTSWYMWITVVCLVCFAALFSGTTNIYGTLLLPIWALMFGYFGWLDWCPWEFQVGVAVLGALVFISKIYSRTGDG